MSKYRRSFQEIHEHWGDQIEFIQESINAFDNGNEKEARRIATSIRATALDNAVMESYLISLKLKLGH